MESPRVQKATFALVAKKLGLDPVRHVTRLGGWFERVARRLADEDSPFHRAIMSALREPFTADEFAILRPRREELVQLLAAYVRSPSFVARYLPLDVPEVREALTEGTAGIHVAREGAAALVRALVEHRDASAMTLRTPIDEFLRFTKELAERRRAYIADGDGEPIDPLTEYLKAVAVQTSGVGDEEAAGADAATFRVQQSVRMVYGDTKRETRERLMPAFNSPMFPEILISSAVLGEGVDLHRFCRYVIHHDLCWNPSTLEQRTGRLDRIRCKAEVALRPIVVYEPFLAGSADERMFRVVRDRERWFQVVMGQRFQFDEAHSEQLANRVLLPDELVSELVFDL
jgi:helicase-like protein